MPPWRGAFVTLPDGSMGRWTDISRDRLPRHWMLMESVDLSMLGETPEAPSLPDIMRVLERVHRAPWTRGPRAPLRRNQGVPVPLETPLFLHRAELDRMRQRRRAAHQLLLWLTGSAALAAAVARILLF